MELLNTPIDSPLFIVIIIIYFIASSIETYDIRIIQTQKEGVDIKDLPNWVSIIYWICWILFIVIIFLNWKYAILIYAIRFILKVLPVLENVGSFLMSLLKK